MSLSGICACAFNRKTACSHGRQADDYYDTAANRELSVCLSGRQTRCCEPTHQVRVLSATTDKQIRHSAVSSSRGSFTRLFAKQFVRRQKKKKRLSSLSGRLCSHQTGITMFSLTECKKQTARLRHQTQWDSWTNKQRRVLFIHLDYWKRFFFVAEGQQRIPTQTLFLWWD